MIPDMREVIDEFEQPFIYVQNIIIDDSGFEGDVVDPIETTIKGVIQIPQDETLQVFGLDYSKNYRQVHIRSDLGIKPNNGTDGVKYKNKNFNVIRFRDFEEYGYYEFIIEESLDGGY